MGDGLMNEISKINLKNLGLKVAFTMAEAMIVLGIVAVLAALSIVAVTNSKPDENIIMFRKAYSTTLQTVQSLMNDKDLYPDAMNVAYSGSAKIAYDLAPTFLRYIGDIDKDEPENPSTTNLYSTAVGSIDTLDFSAMVTKVSGLGFTNNTISSAMKSKYTYLSASGVSSSNKFAVSFANRLNPVGGYTVSGTTVTFKTGDGVNWSISDGFGNANGTTYIDAQVASDHHCSYNSNSCKVPDTYRFKVDKSGTVNPVLSNGNADPAACVFIKYNKINKASKIPASNGCGY